MMSSNLAETAYPLYKNQMTLYISYDAGKVVSGTIRDFVVHIPNILSLPSNTPVVLQLIRVNTSSFNPQVGAANINSLHVRSPDLPNLQSFDSFTQTNSTILTSIPRYVVGADYQVFNPFDKVFQSFKSVSPFGKNVRFQLTDYKGTLIDAGSLPDSLEIIMNVFW